MKIALSIGIHNSQLNESLNTYLKICLKPDLNIIQFFKQFEGIVCDKPENLRWSMS